jgi:pimeloyl-ACP methyl ester carboxylesterase
MAIVLLHGNPETPAIWDDLRREWNRDDILTPALPGFGCPRPQGFSATMEAYHDWLVDFITAIDEPTHLIGHDWGGILTARVAITHPDILASWASDAVGALHPRYVWHDAAQGWQTPEVGEEMMVAMTTPPFDQRVAILEAIGVPPAAAAILAGPLDETMGDCALDLYRSAAQPALAAWGAGAQAAARTRGAFLHATADPFVGAASGTKDFITVMGAEVIALEGAGHWWMVEDPSGAARVCDEWVNRQP